MLLSFEPAQPVAMRHSAIIAISAEYFLFFIFTALFPCTDLIVTGVL